MEKIVLYPAPGISHIISMVELGKLLLTHSKSRSSVAILVPSFPLSPTDSKTNAYMSSVSSSFPCITFHTLPTVPLRHEDPTEYPDGAIIIYESVRNNNANVQATLQSLSLTSKISAFIIDFFAYPALEIAHSLDIPTYFFWTSSAAALALCLNFPSFDKMANDAFKNLEKTVFEIPGFVGVPGSEMIDCMLDRGVSYYEFVNMGATLAKSEGIIINSIEALEVRAVKGLKEGTCLKEGSIPPVYCVGPLIDNKSSSSKKGEEIDQHECLNWLDSQPCRSVVYLCFGSRASFSKEQIREIALGLERSRVRFLWVLRAPPSEDKAKLFLPLPAPDLDTLLPKGFMERTKGRGFVVKSWAPQIPVLEHEAIGGFVTHCGWNSTLEAVCAGVPMVTWPIYAEQRFNRIVLTKELGIALSMDMIETNEGTFVSSDEIEKRVKQIIDSKEGDMLRKRVFHLKDEAKAALAKGGFAEMELSKFVESWKLIKEAEI